jgi:hypothetical protein
MQFWAVPLAALDSSPDEQAIRKAIGRIVELYNVHAVAAVFAPDARMIFRNGAGERTEEIKQDFAQAFTDGPKRAEDVDVGADLLPDARGDGTATTGIGRRGVCESAREHNEIAHPHICASWRGLQCGCTASQDTKLPFTIAHRTLDEKARDFLRTRYRWSGTNDGKGFVIARLGTRVAKTQVTNCYRLRPMCTYPLETTYERKPLSAAIFDRSPRFDRCHACFGAAATAAFEGGEWHFAR